MSYDLDFEKPLAEIDRRIGGLRKRGDKARPEEVAALERELAGATADVYGRLTPWQRVQVARHKDRPYTSDYIRFLFPDFFEMRGDRRFGDDRAIIGGMATFAGRTVMVIGHQKGRDTKERMECNFGMAHPEGYRKALRLMQHAERFGFPVLTFIDTPGAFLNLAAEERGIAEAIAENLQVMAVLGVPIISTIIGEGGSGGALGIGVGDRILMLENSVYTVASPEAAASILWKSNDYAPQAAEAMKITAADLLELRLIDRIIREPLGGAHRDHRATAEALGAALSEELAQLVALPSGVLLDHRYSRLRAIGAPASVAV
ncbi:MAG: acetyl-CoA carboxylase carboxyltransferase subunit alpha [Ktedonobacterales bacterium]|nr:acetyl-CoA carboxylase carboxyltransferase subunit alpha [Ktedonobacterales bacterium]